MVATHVATSPDRPFFLYLAFTAPHWPLQAQPADIEHYRGRFDAGWDELRAARFERERELGIVSDDAVLPPRDPTVAAWDETPDREWQARRMEVYAAMVTAMDRAVGRVVGALESAAALDDTLVLFLSDNGACGEEFRWLYVFAPLVVKIPPQTADGRAVRFGDRPDVVPGPADTYTTYGRGWAHLSNTPLRRYKHWTHEGGIAVPFFVHWPAQLAARAGAIVEAPAHVVDLVPTLDEIARDDAGPPIGSERRGSSRPMGVGAGCADEPAGRSFAASRPRRARSTGSTRATARSPTATGSWSRAGRSAGSSTTSPTIVSRPTTSRPRTPSASSEMAAHWNDWAAEVGVEHLAAGGAGGRDRDLGGARRAGDRVDDRARARGAAVGCAAANAGPFPGRKSRTAGRSTADQRPAIDRATAASRSTRAESAR